CTTPLVCRSGHCVGECQQDNDCAAGETCTSNRCTVKPPTGVTVPPEYGTTCSYTPDCPLPVTPGDPALVCRANHCVYECIVDGDCGFGAKCVNYACQGTIGGSGGSGAGGGANGGAA